MILWGQRKPPCTQSVRFPPEKHGFGHSKCKTSEKRRGFGAAKGARSQLHLRVTSVFLGDLYDFGTGRVQLEAFSGVL